MGSARISSKITGMKNLGDFLKNDRLKELTKHPRHKMIDEIFTRVNRDRVYAGYKPLSMKVYAIKVSHLGVDDLHFLVKRMSQSSSPAKVFFGSLKVKKVDSEHGENGAKHL